MNTTGLLLSLLFGTIGMGYLIYGKRMAEFIPMCAGFGLMVVPYFIPNNIILVIVCVAIMAVPFIRAES